MHMNTGQSKQKDALKGLLVCTKHQYEVCEAFLIQLFKLLTTFREGAINIHNYRLYVLKSAHQMYATTAFT
jgi:hypothetical protein